MLLNKRMFEEIAVLDVKPAFVVNTGDVCEVGAASEYAMLAKAVAGLRGIPIYHVPGNHDVRWNPRGKEGYTTAPACRCTNRWDHENVHFVTLDTPCCSSTGATSRKSSSTG